MLQKPASHRRALLGYVLALPLAACLVMCTQSERDQPQTEADRARQATSNRPVRVDGKIYNAVEQSPKFPGGMAKLGQYLGENLKYPEAAQKAKAEGRVFVRFVVTKEGDVTNVQILKGIGHGADEEAVRVVSQMPRWEPAIQDGKAVNVQYHLPINFQLEDKKADEGAPFKGISHFIVDGKEVTKDQLMALSPNKIVRVEVNKDKSEVKVITKQ